MDKIVILHGWSKNLEKWEPFIAELKKKGLGVKLPKIPGLTEKLTEVWNLDNYVEWLKKITEKEKEKIILIGHSNGGRIGLAFANKYPERLKKLILIDSAGIYHNEIPLRLKRIVFKTIAKIGKKITSSGRLKTLLYKFTRESDYRDLDQTTRKTMLNLINADLKNILPSIQTPTLIIWGANDKITPLTDGKLMYKLIKNSKLVIFDARHSPQFTNAGEVAEIIYGNI